MTLRPMASPAAPSEVGGRWQQAARLELEDPRARGVGVVIEAEHLCMTARGVRKPGARMVTSALRGRLREDVNSRQEFLRLIGE